jgi:hypothetical protein
MAKSTKNRSPQRSTPRHPIALASTARTPDPMTCALAAESLITSSTPSGPALGTTVDPKTPRAKQDFGEFRMQFVGPGF